MTHSMTGNQFNDTLTYNCLEGFTHTSGDLQSRCDHLGVWTGKRPICGKSHIKKKIRYLHILHVKYEDYPFYVSHGHPG